MYRFDSYLANEKRKKKAEAYYERQKIYKEKLKQKENKGNEEESKF